MNKKILVITTIALAIDQITKVATSILLNLNQNQLYSYLKSMSTKSEQIKQHF